MWELKWGRPTGSGSHPIAWALEDAQFRLNTCLEGSVRRNRGPWEEKVSQGKGGAMPTTDGKTYQDDGNGAGWSGGSPWFLELQPETQCWGTGCLPTPLGMVEGRWIWATVSAPGFGATPRAPGESR